MGVPGCVLMSADGHKRIKNQEEIETKTLGHFEFKNVEEPVEVYAISNNGFIVPKRQELKGKLKGTWKYTRLWLSIALIIIILMVILLLKDRFGKNTQEPTPHTVSQELSPQNQLPFCHSET